jgi:four helix bundle protein
MFRFERLRVWHKAVELYDIVDSIACKLPAKTAFALADQLRRAALSVSANIAEGSGRETSKDSAHFFTVAKASTYEVVSVAYVCQRRRLMSAEQYKGIYGRAEDIARMLTGLKQVPASG